MIGNIFDGACFLFAKFTVIRIRERWISRIKVSQAKRLRGTFQLLCENIVVDNATTRGREDHRGKDIRWECREEAARRSRPMRNDILLFPTPSQKSNGFNHWRKSRSAIHRPGYTSSPRNELLPNGNGNERDNIRLWNRDSREEMTLLCEASAFQPISVASRQSCVSIPEIMDLWLSREVNDIYINIFFLFFYQKYFFFRRKYFILLIEINSFLSHIIWLIFFFARF